MKFFTHGFYYYKAEYKCFIAVFLMALFNCQVLPAGSLNVLLTNDDGFDAPGIKAMRSALLAQGHSVTVVAPLNDQSGAGVSLSTDSMSFVEMEPGVWALDGRPADAVQVALNFLFKDVKPDLVISGANLGQNLGFDANSSGTVGAAIMAMQLGVPAIAVSVGLRLEEYFARPQFGSTLKVFPDAAEFVVKQLLDVLLEFKGTHGFLLPPRIVLNVNYPALDRLQIKGTRLVPLGRCLLVDTTFEEIKDGVLKPVYRPSTKKEGLKGADTVVFYQGFITVSVLDGDWSVR